MKTDQEFAESMRRFRIMAISGFFVMIGVIIIVSLITAIANGSMHSDSSHYVSPYSDLSFVEKEKQIFIQTGCVGGGFHPEDCPPNINPIEWEDFYNIRTKYVENN